MCLSRVVAFYVLLLNSARCRRVQVNVAMNSGIDAASLVTGNETSMRPAGKGSARSPRASKRAGLQGDPCEGAGLRDPDEGIAHFLQDLEKKEGPLLEIIVRPVNKKARELMCKGEAVGKGLDIKGKSAVSQGNNGLVPFCQACSIRGRNRSQSVIREPVIGEDKADVCHGVRPVNGDLEQFGRDGVNDIYQFLEGEYAVGSTLAADVLAHSEAVCYCRNTLLSLRIDGAPKCFATNRPSDPFLQSVNAGKIAEPTKDLPLGVERRVITMRSHRYSGFTMNMPFMAYVTMIHGRRVTLPVVSDYDILSIAECPQEEKKGSNKYPMYNGDPEFFAYFQELVDHSMEKQIALNAQRKKGKAIWVHISHDRYNTSKQKVLERAKDKFAGLGIGDLSSLKYLSELVLHSTQTSGSGAIRHGQESYNYDFPQGFVDQEYPTFTAKGRARAEIGKTGLIGVTGTYRNLFERGCCVPMNYVWLLEPSVAAFWQQVWEEGRALAMPGGNLEGCPFYGNDGLVKKVERHREAMNML